MMKHRTEELIKDALIFNGQLISLGVKKMEKRKRSIGA